MTHEDQLKNRGSSRWIRGCLGFRYLGQGLIHTVDTVIKNQHETFIKNKANSACNKCSMNGLLPDHPPQRDKHCVKGRRKCFCFMNINRRRLCPNNFCSAVYDSIVDAHRVQDPNWSNSDITKWGTSYVEVAKCFIAASGYRNKGTIQEMDCSGLLHIVINNNAFDGSLTKTTTCNPLSLVIKAKDNRNTLFHSPDMELSEDQLTDMTDNIISLLQLPGILDPNGEAASSVQKLKQLRDGEIFISPKDEIEIRRETLQSFETQLNDIKTEMKQTKDDLADEVKDLTIQCNKNMTELQENTDEKVISVKSDVKKVEKICEELEQRQTNLETSIDQLQATVRKLASKYPGQGLEENISENLIHQLCSELLKMIEKFVTINARNEQEADMIANLTSAHKVKLQYLQREQELQRRLCDYYKRCLSTVPVSPVLKVLCGSVNEIFVELSLVDLERNENDIEEARPVSSYADLLIKSNELCQNVYVLGEAGMGKTTWCKKILNTWVKACDNECKDNNSTDCSPERHRLTDAVESDVQVDEDEVFLSRHFNLLFYIALRQESEHANIIDMVKALPVVKEYSLQTNVDEAFQCQQQRCLVVLDGLDEWTPQIKTAVPGRDGLHGCPVIITSRPYRLSGLYNDSTFIVDRKVKIAGVRDKESLVMKVINQLNKIMKKSHTKCQESGKSDYEGFMEDVKAMKDVDLSYRYRMTTFMDVPLILIIMVCLWFDKGKFEDTLSKNIPCMIEFIIRYAEGSQSGVLLETES